MPKGRGPTPPPEKQRPGPPRRSLSAIPVGHGQRLEVERAGRSGCRSAVITRPSFHTLSSPPVPGTSPEPGAGGFGRQQISSRPSLGGGGYVEVSDGAGRPHPDRGFPASAGARVWGCGPAGGSGAAAVTPAPCPRTRAFGQEDALSSAGARRADASWPRRAAPVKWGTGRAAPLGAAYTASSRTSAPQAAIRRQPRRAELRACFTDLEDLQPSSPASARPRSINRRISWP